VKTICLFSPGNLPVPAVRGGAIETLLHMLIEQNEVEQKAKFVVVSVYDEEAERASRQYKQTEFIFIKKNKQLDNLYKGAKVLARKLFRIRFDAPNLYYYQGFQKVLDAHPDVVVAEDGYYEAFSGLTKKMGKEKLYLHVHHHLTASEKLADIFTEVISVSAFVKKELLPHSALSENQVTVLRNAIDEDRFKDSLTVSAKKALREKLGMSENDFVVLFCGRVIPEKGVKELILALEKVSDKNVKLLILGSPNFALNTKSTYLDEIEDLVKQNGDRMVFTGYVANNETYQYYGIADVVIVPTLIEEAAPLVVLEAMSVGRPLIVTDSGGIPEYATEACAIILKRDEALVDNLAASITAIKDDAALRESLSEGSKERSKLYTKNIFYTDFIGLFDK
jgi:glycosyltransferase involved in cell wall biosynthesis